MRLRKTVCNLRILRRKITKNAGNVWKAVVSIDVGIARVFDICHHFVLLKWMLREKGNIAVS